MKHRLQDMEDDTLFEHPHYIPARTIVRRQQMSKIEEIINELINKIRFHDRKYYAEDDPAIEDFEYDLLMMNLIKLESQYPHLVTPQSPTQRVGAKPIDKFSSVEHDRLMLSLDNCNSDKELDKFDERIRKQCPGPFTDYVVEVKLDGMGISLVYEKGILIRGVTRGDGREGEDVTSNVKTIKSIPLVITAKGNIVETFEVRGEIYMRKSILKELNVERERDGEASFANTRNAAAGSVRLLDPRITAKRRLDIFLYNLEYESMPPSFYHWDRITMMKQMGFVVNPFNRRCDNIEQVKHFCERWVNERETLDYDIDGIVIKVNSLVQQTAIGVSSTSPKWAMAYKFPAMQATGKIIDIEVQVGRTGILTPVAKISPTKIGGTIISSITLHNEDNITDKDIRIGDTVVIERAGDVIPAIVRVVVDERTGEEKKFEMPKLCPACLCTTVRYAGESATRCISLECPSQLKAKIIHLAESDAMDIEGLGETLAEQLVENGLVENPFHIYLLQEEEVAALDRMGETSARNLMESIEYSRHRKFHNFIYALGIRQIGIGIAEILAKSFQTLEDLEDASCEGLERISGIGEGKAESINDYFQGDEYEATKRICSTAGLGIIYTSISKKSGQTLEGKSFVITGSLTAMKRIEAEKAIKDSGGMISSGVSSRTDFIVIGNKPGSTYDRAEKLGITLLTEDELVVLVKEDINEKCKQL